MRRISLSDFYFYQYHRAILMKKISIITPTYNEEENVVEIYESVKRVLTKHVAYNYEHVFIDNASTDKTVTLIKEIASKDKQVKLIVNSRNFGHIRSPMHAFFLVEGDAVSMIAADLQDPPELISEFIKEWENGHPIVVASRRSREEGWLFGLVRKTYYRIINRLSDVELIKNFHGYGLYDRVAVEAMRKLNDPYPYFRGMVCEIGFSRKKVLYDMPARKRGFTKNNLYSLYDMAMLGFVNHSKVPLRLAIFVGFGMAMISFAVAVGYLVYKLLFWQDFVLGMAPLVIGIFLLGSVQLIFMGILGEYLGAVQGYVRNRPLVFEKERVNF